MPLKVFPLISVKGIPYECGLQYGSQARSLVHKHMEFYFDLWQRLWNADRTKLLQECRRLVPIIGEYDAEILEELEGLAKGADLSLEEIVALNARYELVWASDLVAAPESGACTCLSALPEVTKDGHTLMGQNWDLWPRVHDHLIVLERQQSGEPSSVTIVEAGIIGGLGMNSAGLGVCLTALVSSLDRFEPKVPVWLIVRGVLKADNFRNAINTVMSTKAAVSVNLLIAHQAGEVIDLEVMPKDVGFLYARDGILGHSNHFLFFTNREDILDLCKVAHPCSLFRFERARRLLAEDRGHIDIDSFQRVFQDHFSYPGSICRHVDPKNDYAHQYTTVLSLIMDLEERSLFVAEGSPCQNEYIKLPLEGII